MHYINLIFNILPKLSGILSNSLYKALFLYIRFNFFLLRKKIRKDNEKWLFHLSLEDKNFEISLFEGSPDIAALKEIFVDGEYEWSSIQDPEIIVDFGAHTGNTALYFHIKYPKAIIYAVEASPKTYERLVQNVKNISNIEPIFGAISDEDGTISFYESQSSLGSSLYKREGVTSKIEVPSFTLETFFKLNGLQKVDFIKIDIEGSEEKLFKETSPEEFSNSYIIEVHDDLMSIERNVFVKRFSNFKVDYKNISNIQRVLLRAIK